MIKTAKLLVILLAFSAYLTNAQSKHGKTSKSRSYNIRKIGVYRLIDFLKNDPEYGGCSAMLGVPTYFRELDKDCLPDPYLHELIKMSDIVLPWMVQRFTPLVHEPLNHLCDHVIADIKWCKEAGVDYVPIAYPGFSWRNLSLSRPDLARYTAYGAIPRLGGRFYWDLMVTFIIAGSEMIYVAMFDEIDEGTAIFKISDTPPQQRQGTFCGQRWYAFRSLFMADRAGCKDVAKGNFCNNINSNPLEILKNRCTIAFIN